MTKLTVTGSNTLFNDVSALRDTNYWTEDDVATVVNFSDGYKLVSEIQLAGDGFSDNTSGTCW